LIGVRDLVEERIAVMIHDGGVFGVTEQQAVELAPKQLLSWF